MNEYDSDKMADVLRDAEGFELTERPEEADVILFNTCSVREKAQERVFHDLGRVRGLKAANPDLIIGVGGCVASQEGAAIVRRAPYVDVVFGPQTLHRLPELIGRRRATGRPQIDISFPEVEKFDHLPPPRVEGASAFVSIMEGCSKYCTFCVVPYTRGEEVSRRFDDVLTEVADLADQGVKEITLLGQTVNGFDGSFSFLYSPRPGTPAADFPDPVPPPTAQARLARLQDAIDAGYRAASARMLGNIERVLVTGRAVRSTDELAARTENNRVVNFSGDAGLIGRYADVRITAAQSHSLRGELVAH